MDVIETVGDESVASTFMSRKMNIKAMLLKLKLQFVEQQKRQHAIVLNGCFIVKKKKRKDFRNCFCQKQIINEHLILAMTLAPPDVVAFNYNGTNIE